MLLHNYIFYKLNLGDNLFLSDICENTVKAAKRYRKKTTNKKEPITVNDLQKSLFILVKKHVLYLRTFTMMVLSFVEFLWHSEVP